MSILFESLFSIAFYNLENFFDTEDDPNTFDDAFTPKGIMHWVKKRFQNKSKKIAGVISQIGIKETGEPPVFIGLAEVENKNVLRNLVKRRSLKKYNYDFIHFESQDKRGMDVALLYRRNLVTKLDTAVYPVILYNHEGISYHARDILFVKLYYRQQELFLFINHWPSRREGDLQSNFKRHRALEILSEQIDYIYYENPQANIIVMGDFNADPDDTNLVYLQKKFINPALNVFKQHQGSLNHHHQWHLFDQILFNRFFTDKHTNIRFQSFHIFNPKYIRTWYGRRKNLPFRTYQGIKYQGGYSDHFPVYAVLGAKKER